MDIKLVNQTSQRPQIRFVKGQRPLRCLPHDRLNFLDLKIRSTKPPPAEFAGKEIERVVAVTRHATEDRYTPICEIRESSNGQHFSTDNLPSNPLLEALKDDFEVEPKEGNCTVSLSNLRFVPGPQLRISRELIPQLIEDVPNDIANVATKELDRYLFLASFNGENELWPLFAFDKEEMCRIAYNYLVQMGKAQKPDLNALKNESFNETDCYDLVKAAMGKRSNSEAEEDFISKSDVAFELGFNESIRRYVKDHIDDIKPWLQSEDRTDNSFWIALMTDDGVRELCKSSTGEAIPRKSKKPKPTHTPVDRVEPSTNENMRFLEMLNTLEANPSSFEDEEKDKDVEYLKTVPIQEYSTRKRIHDLILRNPDEICSYALASNKSLIETDDPKKTKAMRTILINLGKESPNSFLGQGAGDNEAIISEDNIRELRDWIILEKNEETLFGENLLKQFKKLGITIEIKQISTHGLHMRYRAAKTEPANVPAAITLQPRFADENPKLAEIFLKIERNRDELTKDELDFLSNVKIQSQATREYAIDLLTEHSGLREREFNFYLAMNPQVIEADNIDETERNRRRLTMYIFNLPNSKAALGGTQNRALISNDENREFLNDWLLGKTSSGVYSHINTRFARAVVNHPLFLASNEDGSQVIRDTICKWSEKNKRTVLGKAVLEKIKELAEPKKEVVAEPDDLEDIIPLPYFPLKSYELRMIMHAGRINKILTRESRSLEERLCDITKANIDKQLLDVNDKLTYYDTLEGAESKGTTRHTYLMARKEALERMQLLSGQELLVERTIDKLSQGKKLNYNFLQWINFTEINLSSKTRVKLTKTIIELTKEPATRHKTAIFHLARKSRFLWEKKEKRKLLRVAKENINSALAMGLRQNPDLDKKELASIALLEKVNDKLKDHKTFLRREETRRLLEYINSKREKTKQTPRAIKPTQKPDSRSNTTEITKAVEMKSEKAKSLLDFFTSGTVLPFDRQKIPGIIFDESDILALITAARTKYKMEAFLLGQNESVRVYIKAHQSDYAYLEEDRNDGRQFAKGYYRPRE